ncbi:MAG: hypothetical protein FE78DRAFT_431224 [Acidomyces sp. 'richmondensis']|nr:MAG: hypothetical protein FE78DRAFT_431224 [Acidomyces sp. 'richmondensis']
MRSSSGVVHQRHANSPFSPEVTWMRTTKKLELVKAQAQAQAPAPAPAPARETLLAPVAQALATWHLSGEPDRRVLYGFCISTTWMWRRMTAAPSIAAVCPTHAGRRCPSPALPNVCSAWDLEVWGFGGLVVWGLSPICQTLQHAFRCALAPRLLSVHRLIPFQATLSLTGDDGGDMSLRTPQWESCPD